MVHGGTLLALGCFQQSPGALLQAVVGTWQWHSIMAFYNLRLLYGAANFKGTETKRGIPDKHAHLKENFWKRGQETRHQQPTGQAK